MVKLCWMSRMLGKARTGGEKDGMHYRPRSGGLVVMVLVFVVIAMAYGQARVLEPLRFAESLRSDAPVAGETFRGIHSGSVVGQANLNALRITLPPGDYSRLCLEVETQDARYFAEAAYDISGTRPTQRYRVRLPTEHRRLLESKPIRDISVLAYVSSGCDSGERLYVPVQWQGDEGARVQLMLLVNARTPSVDVRVFHKENRRYFGCIRDTETERRVAFDTECLLGVDPGPRLATLVLVRNRFEHRLKNITIRAYLP